MVGKTQASRVMPFVGRSEGESGTVTRALEPLKESPFPYLPAVVQVALPIEPAFPPPEASATLVPLRSVFCHDRPTIGFGSHAPSATIEHRLDGENHAFAEGEAGSRLSVVQNLRFLMHFPADAMTAIFTHHGIAISLGMSFDRPADVSKARARANRPDAHPHGFLGGLDQLPGGRIYRANEIGFAGIRDIAVLLERDVEIDDVAVPKHVGLRGDTVADHIVH